MWKEPLLAAILMTLALPASSAVAPSPDAPVTAETAAGTNEQIEIDRELAQFRESPISLCQALVAAERQHPGAKIWDIGFDGTPDSPVYRIKSAEAGLVRELTVDARTGELAEGDTVTRLKDLDAADRENVMKLRTIRQGLSDAVLVAERAAKGKAIGGTFSRANTGFRFAVVVVSGDDLKQVLLEPPMRGRGSPPAPHAVAGRAC
jgi:hypothetical protein